MYSYDLINSVINYSKKYQNSLRKTSEIFSISKSSIHRWLKELPIKHKVSSGGEDNGMSNIILFIKRSLDHNPYQTLDSLQIKINRKFNKLYSITKIRKFMKIIGYTKKKAIKRIYNGKLKEHINNRKNFMNKMKNINKSNIICLDEVGINRNTYGNRGWCHKSRRLKYYVNYHDLPTRKSLIVAISNEKLIKYHTECKSINKEIFIKFIKELTTNLENKYILMDNIAFHKSKEILEIIKKSNNMPLFIPPYSPDMNPIEEYFSCFKAYLRKNINPVTIGRDINKLIREFFKIKYRYNSFYTHAFS